jgi:hypothetical protein
MEEKAHLLCAWCGYPIDRITKLRIVDKDQVEHKNVTHGICRECVNIYFGLPYQKG